VNGRVLVVEDEDHIADLVRMYLEAEHYEVQRARSGEEGLEMFDRMKPRLVILDLMLPGIDGVEVCRRLREKTRIPVVMLTARDSEIDKVVGLEMGADDYVTKPFSPRELMARVKAVLRRVEEPPQVEARDIGDIHIDHGRRLVVTPDGEIQLTPKEFDLLWYLAENRGLVVSRDQIMEAVWGYEWYGESRTVDAHVRQLRRKLAHHLPLKTVWGVGYQLGR
jgi:two-component system response regulator ResD